MPPIGSCCSCKAREISASESRLPETFGAFGRVFCKLKSEVRVPSVSIGVSPNTLCVFIAVLSGVIVDINMN